MAKKIIELVREKKAAMAANDVEAEENAALAVAAIKGGRTSPEWETYMLQFVEKDPNDGSKPLDPNQLKRLLATDNTQGDVVMDRRRAYMLGNAVCGAPSPATTGALDFQVETIDATLPGSC